MKLKRITPILLMALLFFVALSSCGFALIVPVTDEVKVVDPLDSSTEALEVIDYEHHEIHAGNHFNYCDYALTQGLNDDIEFVITTPDSAEWNHFTFRVSSSTGATVEFYEGSTGVTGGTSITPRNNDRNSIKTSSMVLVKDPTAVTVDGMRAAGYVAGGSRVDGFAERTRENILKQNTSYLVRITSLAASNDISWCAEWYEHTSKN